MQKRILGRTGIEVTELCFGALPMGPLQKNLDIEKGAQVVEAALRNGINFIDTAEMYRTYDPIRIAMERTGIRPVIASKSTKTTYEGMESAVNEALEKLGVNYIDIFHLHGSRGGKELFTHFEGALKCLVDMKAKGVIRAVGISTHSIAAANLAADKDEIDVVFPIINKSGLGIIDGTKEDMVKAIDKAYKNGKGVYLMKVLAGGSLINKYMDAMEYARKIEGYTSIAVGMVTPEEVLFNTSYFNGELKDASPKALTSSKKVMVVKRLCAGCGTCIATCPNFALSLGNDGKAFADEKKCLTCGYCTPVCPQFAIRIV